MVAEIRSCPDVLHVARAPEGEREHALIFVADAHAVATAADPLLAALLGDVLGRAHGRAAPCGWRGDRRSGLELCRRLLLYVRGDVLDRRIDVSLGYIACELDRIETPSAAAPFS